MVWLDMRWVGLHLAGVLPRHCFSFQPLLFSSRPLPTVSRTVVMWGSVVSSPYFHGSEVLRAGARFLADTACECLAEAVAT